jgi:hypothetical protein
MPSFTPRTFGFHSSLALAGADSTKVTASTSAVAPIARRICGFDFIFAFLLVPVGLCFDSLFRKKNDSKRHGAALATARAIAVSF